MDKLILVWVKTMLPQRGCSYQRPNRPICIDPWLSSSSRNPWWHWWVAATLKYRWESCKLGSPAETTNRNWWWTWKLKYVEIIGGKIIQTSPNQPGIPCLSRVPRNPQPGPCCFSSPWVHWGASHPGKIQECPWFWLTITVYPSLPACKPQTKGIKKATICHYVKVEHHPSIPFESLVTHLLEKHLMHIKFPLTELSR